MALPTLVQFKAFEPAGIGATVAFNVPPTPGNLWVLIKGGDASLAAEATQSGFTNHATARNDVGSAFFRRCGSLQTRVVQSGDTGFVAPASQTYFMWEFAADAELDSFVAASSQGAYGVHHQTSGGPLTPTAARPVRIYGYAGVRNGNFEDLTHTSTPDAGWTQDWFTPDLNWNYPQAIILHQDVISASGPYTPGSTMTLTGAANGTSYFGFTFAIGGSTPVLAPPPVPQPAFPVVRGTMLVGLGSTAVGTVDGGDPDHDAFQIGIADAGGYLSATDVETALHELATGGGLSDHLTDVADAHDAAAVSFVPGSGVAATEVQAAIVEVADDVGGHLIDTTAHTALRIPFSPAAGLVSTNVQDAIAEAAALSGGVGGSVDSLVPVMATNPNIVTTDGTAVWVVLVLPDGTPVMLVA